MATSDAAPEELPADVSADVPVAAVDPTADPTAAAISAVIDPLIENEKAIAAGYAERARLLAELDQLGHDPRIIAGLCGDPIESGRNDPDTEAHGPAWDDEELARRTMATEAAGALRLHPTTAGGMIFNAGRLTRQLPAFHQALTEGSITWGHALKMLDLTQDVPVEILPAFEAKVLPEAQTRTSTQFLRVASLILDRMHPVSLQDRANAGASQRKVVMQPDADGMAWLKAYLKADEAQAIYDRLSRIATDLDAAEMNDASPADSAASAGPAAPVAPVQPRTKDQRRADALRDLLLDGEGPGGLGRGIRGTVHVTVPVLTLLGQSDEPAILEGYGPIDPEAARRIAGTATSFTRILTHPETGCRLSVGRNSYAVPADLRRYLQIRDGTCQGIGCNRRATLSEIDHTQAWNTGGTTSADNLVHLCKPCHRLKHQSSFSTSQGPGGALTWTSPGGKKYTSQPATDIGGSPNPAAPDSLAGRLAPDEPRPSDPPPF